MLALLEATSNLKHKAILAVLYSSGIRMDELLHLRLKDIDSDRMTIRVANGKGQRSRETLLSHYTLALLRDYYRSFLPKPTIYLFEGRGKNSPLYSATSIRKILHRAVAKTGIQKKVHPHSLPHCFATGPTSRHLLEQGVNLRVIQQLLGHQSINSTMIYLHVAQLNGSVKSPLDIA